MRSTGFHVCSKAALLGLFLALSATGAAHALSFSGPVNFSAGSSPPTVSDGLFNADAIPDLAVANDGSSNISVLLGNGSGGFTGPTNFLAGTNPASVAVGLFNADSNADLAVANDGSNNVSILLGNGAGGFGPPTNFGSGLGPLEIAVGLFNADSNADLAVANEATNDVSILLGNGAGGFTGPTNFPAGSGPSSLVTGQFNGDANLDLAVANDFSSNVSILLGNGTGGFSAPTNFAVGSSPAEVAVGQFNGDSNTDLALANAGNTVSILLGNGAGSFSGPTNFAAGTGPSSLAVGDLDGDSHVDLAVANDVSNNVSVLLGDAAGGFTAPINFAAGSAPSSILAGQLNGDTRLDLAVANEGSNNVSVLLNTTTLGFPRPKGATPLRTSLVPAFVQCSSSNTTHGSPLAFGSCTPPVQASSYVTVGSPDANGAPASSSGSVEMDVKVSAPSDVLINASITDVRCKLPVATTCGSANAAAGPDYAGALREVSTARITDMFNAVGGGAGTGSATVQDVLLLPLTIPCADTASLTVGASCAVSTTANSLLPGSVQTGQRAVWQLSQIRVIDGGPDGDPATAGNTDFAKQGILEP